MIKRNKIVGIFGPRGSGKTFTAASLYGREQRAVCYNTANDMEFFIRSTYQATGGEEIAVGLKSLAREKSFRLNFIPTDLHMEDKESGVAPSFDEVCWQVFKNGDMSLYVDEMHYFTQPNYAPEDFRRIVSMGRHQRVNLCYMTHRFAEIWRKLTSETDTFIFFSMHEPRDLQYIKDICGEEVSRIVPTLRRLDMLRNPPVPGEYYEWDSMTRIGKRVSA